MAGGGGSAAQNLSAEVIGAIIKIATSPPASALSNILPPSWNIDNGLSFSTMLINIQQEDSKRRSLSDLEACARVCKAWSGPAVEALYQRVDIVVDITNGVVSSLQCKGLVPLSLLVRKTVMPLPLTSPSHRSDFRSCIKLGLTNLGRLVRHIHLWLSSEKSETQYSKSPLPENTLNAFALNVVTLHLHTDEYDGYRPCRCNDPKHQHERGLESFNSGERVTVGTAVHFIFSNMVQPFLEYIFLQETDEISLKNVIIDGLEGNMGLLKHDQDDFDFGAYLNFDQNELEETSFGPNSIDRIVLIGNDQRTWGVGGQIGLMDKGGEKDGQPKVETLGKAYRGMRNLTLRRLSQPLNLNGIKEFVVGIARSGDTGNSGRSKSSRRGPSTHLSEDTDFLPNLTLAHLDFDMLTQPSEIGQVIRILFRHAPNITSLILDRWALTDVQDLANGSDSILSRIVAVRPRKLRSLVLPSWTFQHQSDNRQRPQQPHTQEAARVLRLTLQQHLLLLQQQQHQQQQTVYQQQQAQQQTVYPQQQQLQPTVNQQVHQQQAQLQQIAQQQQQLQRVLYQQVHQQQHGHQQRLQQQTGQGLFPVPSQGQSQLLSSILANQNGTSSTYAQIFQNMVLEQHTKETSNNTSHELLFRGWEMGCFKFLRVLGISKTNMTAGEFTMLIQTVPLLEVLDARKCLVRGENLAGYKIGETLSHLQVLDLDSLMGFCGPDNPFDIIYLALYLLFRLDNLHIVVLPYSAMGVISKYCVKGSAGKCFGADGLARLRKWMKRKRPQEYDGLIKLLRTAQE
ncbi:hypothetical protein HDU76_012980, partial [Blyttiomyces sp. JEL0837]